MPAHHPLDETLIRHAARRLPPVLSLAIETHLSCCPQCRKFVMQCESVGGALLEASAEELLETDALAKVLARIDTEEASAAPQSAPAKGVEWPMLETQVALPVALRSCDFEPWQWVAPGMHVSRVTSPARSDAGSLILLKIGAGRALPVHGHAGIELTQVLKGHFSDDTGRYGPGDLIEMDDDVVHHPVVDGDAECICLVATENKLVFKGLIARLVQSWTGL